MAVAGKVLFHLTDDALIVANSGEAFTPEGVISICNMHLSEKTGKPKGKYGNDLIVGIAKSAVKLYQEYPDRLAEDVTGEKNLGGDYKGRSVWELLQNADDAATIAALGIKGASGRLIGAKGLGFKSILEISESPEIYSGKFKFRFSREDSYQKLNNAKVDVKSGVPTFRIPHKCKPNGECLRILEDGYTTVLRLPFVSDKANKAEKWLNELDASCLLFCQRLSRIEIKIRGESRVIAIDRNGVFGFEKDKATFTLKENGEIRKWRRWSAAWTPENKAGAKKLSAALCLPIVESGEAPMDEERPVHVFFPTNQEVRIPGLKALIHASYELQSNREHLDNEQPHGEEIRGKIGELAVVILKNIPPATALRAFGEVTGGEGCEDDEKSEVERIQSVIAAAVDETAFVPVIGGEEVKPAEARIWEHGLGQVLCEKHLDVRKAKLLDPSLSAEQDVRGILEKFEAKSATLHEHATLLQSCRSDTLNACHEAWQVAGDIACEAKKVKEQIYGFHAQEEDADADLDALKDAPIWWTEEGQPRPLNGNIPLLHKRPAKWPEWLEADALSPEFREEIENTDEPNALKNQKIWPLYEARSYFTNALLPFCEKQNPEWWEKMGWDVLRWAFLWGGGAVSKGPFIMGLDNVANRIGRSIRVPTDKGWLPAVQCYAGKDWDGTAGFGEYFQGVKDRGVLSPIGGWKLPDELKKDKGKRKDFLRGLGVSWEPKVLLFEFNEDEFNEDEYKEYCLRSAQERYRTAYKVNNYKDNTRIEHFPDGVAKSGPAQILRVAREVTLLADKVHTKAEYSYSHGTREIHLEPFTRFQLRRSEWVPCRPGLLHSAKMGKVLLVAPKDALMPDCGMGILPEIIRGECSNDEWHGNDGIKEMLKGLGVPAGLPDEPERFHEWMNMLAQYAEKLDTSSHDRRWNGAASERGNIARAAKLLFAAYFRKCPETPIPEDISAPFLRKTPKGEFVYFAPAREIFHADEPHFAENNVRTKILEEESIKVFPLFLNDSNAQHAELAALSHEMSMRVVKPVKKSPEETEELRSRYKVRRLLLEKAAGAVLGKDISLSESIKIFACKKITMESSKYQDIDPEIDFCLPEGKESSLLYVNTDGGENRRWNSLAGGIAELTGMENYRAHFQNFLQEKEHDECLRALRNAPFYLTEEALQELQIIEKSGDPAGDNSYSDEKSSSDNEETADEPIDGNGDTHVNGGGGPPANRERTSGGRPGGWGNGGDSETRQQIEAIAVKVVRAYYQGKRYEVASVEDDNMGWDLKVYPPDRKTLQVEVKGISANRISVELTPNEYSKSNGEMYRLAIVRDALSDKPACAIYKRDGYVWRLEEGDDENPIKQLVTEEKTGATVKEDKKR